MRFANWLHNGQPDGAQGLATTEDGAMSNTTLIAITRESEATWFLPTEDEWYKAAHHKNEGATGAYWDDPTGTDLMPSNDLPDQGNNANFFQNGYTVDSPYWRTAVGEFEYSASPYGTLDQAGNLWEWNEAAMGASRGVRGGAFNNGSGVLLASYRRTDIGPGYEDDHIGFRVASTAAVPEPDAVAMLAGLGVVGIVVARHCRQKKSRQFAVLDLTE